MASFEKRVTAAATAMAPLGREGIGYWTTRAYKSIRASDAMEPEIVAVRAWLAGEAVDETTLPERLREVLSERDEARAEVERLKRELDEERAWMREEKRHNIQMRAALDEIAVCLGRDGDDLKVLVEDVQRCSDGVVAADEKIERLTQERDALAAKVREQTAALACIESLGTSGNETQRPSACIARETRLSIQRRADAARFEAQEAAREKAAKFPQHCEYCDHVPGCGPRDGCDCAVCCHDPTPDDGGDVIDWRARALAAEAEVAKLRAALVRATRPLTPREAAAHFNGLAVDTILAARRAKSMGGGK